MLGAGCRCWCWCCELVETGCGCWCRVPGAGCCDLAVHVVETGCWRWRWCRVPALVLVLGAGAGAGGVACICEGVYFRSFFLGSEAMGFLLQITMRAACARFRDRLRWRWCCELCTWWRHGAGAGAGCRVPAPVELAVHVVETGWRWGCARGGDRVPGAGCRCWALPVRLVERTLFAR